jgi:predicted porin
MASITFTAPTNWGWMSGSTVSAGVVNGFNAANGAEGAPDRETSVYAGATLSTPLTALKLGASMDYEGMHNWTGSPGVVGPGEGDGSIWAFALYSSFQATEKMSLNLRGEFVDDRADALKDWSDLPHPMNAGKIYALTATAQYDLWKNVLSRVEFRWDHADNGEMFGGTVSGAPSRNSAFMLAANIIYKF